MADRVGQHIDDYRLMRLLGTGSFGEVYLGEHLESRTPAAVKMLNLSQENLKEFVKEASTAFRLKHPHIIGSLAFGMSADDTPYLVMDYASNGTLRQRHPKGTCLPLDTIVSYLLPLAEALQYAHDRRVIHRDVKPENVLIGQDGKILLSDFGIAVIAPLEKSLRTQNMGGTVPYMAPEQIRGKPLPASDQYALGIMAYEWLCGVRPFQGTMWEIIDQHRSLQPPPLREKLPDLPPMVEEIIFRALAKDPQERFARVQDFATALEEVVHIGKPSPALSSLSLSLAPSPTDVSLQPEQAPTRSAIPQQEQGPSKLSSRETLANEYQPLVEINPIVSSISPIVSVPSSSSYPSVSSHDTLQPVFVPSTPPAVRRSPISRKIILFIGLILVIIGGSVFLSPSVIHSLVKNPSLASTPTIAPPLITATHVYNTDTVISELPLVPQTSLDCPYKEFNQYTDLTSEGTLDWIQWGLNTATDVNRKAATTSLISNVAFLGNGHVGSDHTNAINFTWSDGNPSKSVKKSAGAIYLSGLNNGFSITVPAKSQLQTLRLYIGANLARGLFFASLNGITCKDASLDTTHDPTKNVSNAVYTITYSTNVPDQKLTINYTEMASQGNAGYILLEAATLQ